MTGQDKVRERLEGLGETIGDSLRDMRDVRAARDYLLAALTAVLDLAAEVTYSVPPSLYEVGTSWVASEIRRRVAAGLGVTP